MMIVEDLMSLFTDFQSDISKDKGILRLWTLSFN